MGIKKAPRQETLVSFGLGVGKKIILEELMVLRSIECGIKRAHSYKPQFEGVTTKKNYDQELNGGSFIEFTEKQIDAVGAECAVAEYLGFNDYLPSNKTYKDKADVGQNIEVKHTYREQGNLINSGIDRNSDLAVLVTGRCPTYYLAGWIWVDDAQNDKYKSELIRGDSYLIPRNKLKSIEHIEMDRDIAYERAYPL